MRELFTTQALTIPTGQAVSGIARDGQMLRVISGRVWVTVEGVSHDYWLFAGDTLALIPGLLTVMEADKASSRIELVPARSGSALLELGARLRHFAQRVAGGKNPEPASQAALAQCKQQMKSCAQY